MNNIIFESIKHIDLDGNEFWHARELFKVIEYTDWKNFLKVLNKAKVVILMFYTILLRSTKW